MRVGGGLGLGQIGPGEQQPAAPPHRLVQRQPRGPALAREQAHLPHPCGEAINDRRRVAERGYGRCQAIGVQPQVVGEQLPGGGGGRWPPRWCRRGRRGRGGVQQGAHQRDGGDAVGDRVMQADEQADGAVGEPGQQPQFPQRARPVQRRLVQLRAHRQQGRLIARRGDRAGAHMLGDAEVGVIGPHRRPQAAAWPYQDLAQARSLIQAPFHHRPHLLQLQPAARITQRRPLNAGQRGDMHGHAVLFGPQVAHIERAQPLQPARP